MAPGDVVFVPDAAGYYHAFKSWDGMLGKFIQHKTVLTALYSRQAAPGPGSRPFNRTGINYGRGVLKRSIIPKRSNWGTELEGRVVALPKYAIFVHEGTKPHVILPKTPGGVLSFKWAKAGGKRVAFKKVHHPGTRRNPFLVVGLRRAIRG